MTTEAVLDRLLVPRPNGSAALADSANYIASLLRTNTSDVALQPFTATPHGFQLLWSAALLLMLGCGAALLLRRHGLALLLAVLTPALLLAETELLMSPISGLWPQTEHNVVATFAGRPGEPLLIFSAHYDSTTHFGDHFDWYWWGWATGPALGVAVVASLAGLWLSRRDRHLPRAVVLAAAILAVLPFGAMAWCFAAGPLLRTPSPGALDNGGAVAALLDLSQRLAQRPPDAPTTVQLVFLAAEEERALGSWHYARKLARLTRVAAINLETIGGYGRLSYAPEEGFQLRRYAAAPRLVRLVRTAAQQELGDDVAANPLPAGVLTDARSFLAHNIAAVTLLDASPDGFPRGLHSRHDGRDRLSTDAIERTAALLAAIVNRVDADPSLIQPGG